MVDLVLILVASVVVAFILNRLRQPTIVGFIVAGVAIGPVGFGVIKDAKQIESQSEIGVMLPPLKIGLEFSPRS